MRYSREDDILIQSYFTTAFLVELENNNFLQSEYYKSMNFGDKYVHQNLPAIGIGNRGAMLMCFYSLLVIPRQFLEMSEYLNQFKILNNKIKTFITEESTNYKSDFNDGNLNVDYLKHLRNSVAHARVEFTNDKNVIFTDIYERDEKILYKCDFKISLENTGLILTGLQSIFLNHIENLKRKQP